MAATILQTIVSNVFFSRMKTIELQNNIPFISVHICVIYNISVMVQIMAWCQRGDKPLSEPMMTQFRGAYMWHQREMSHHEGMENRTKNIFYEINCDVANLGKSWDLLEHD